MKKVKTSVMYILLSLWALVNLFPLYWMFTFSLKTNKEIFGDNIIGTCQKNGCGATIRRLSMPEIWHFTLSIVPLSPLLRLHSLSSFP